MVGIKTLSFNDYGFLTVLTGCGSPGSSPPRLPNRERRAGGFTMIEMVIVMAIGAVLLTLATTSFSAFNTRSSARKAAQVFARDLTLARSSARRERVPVVIKFFEGTKRYTVTTGSGRQMASRRFGVGQDVNLSAVDLQLPGDSLAFSGRGIATLSGALGYAKFTAGVATYTVTFNSMGASKVGGS